MTPIPTIVHTLIAIPSPTLKSISTLTSHTTYHVIIDNLNKFCNLTSPLLTVAFIALTALLSWLFQHKRDHDLKEDEKREKLYAPLRLYLSTLRSIDRQYEKIRQAADESDKEALKILDDERQSEEYKKSISSRFEYLDKVTDKWHDCLKKIYELIQSNPGLIKEEHYKTIDKFIDGYMSSHYFEKLTTEDSNKLYPIKYYFDRYNSAYFKAAVHELEKVILGSSTLDSTTK